MDPVDRFQELPNKTSGLGKMMLFDSLKDGFHCQLLFIYIVIRCLEVRKPAFLSGKTND